MAYTKLIGKNSEDSHQISPAYLLTFIRWSNRDVLNQTGEDFLAVRRPLVVINDAISIQVQYSKQNPLQAFSCTLKQGDLNYMTAIHPGDYVLVNIVNDEPKALELRQRALDSKAINRYNDGFKGVFKISDVRMTLTTNPSTGQKEYVVSVTARAFDEFNNTLYFNPALTNETALQKLFLNNFKNFLDLIVQKDKNNVQPLVKTIIKRTIGVGMAKVAKQDTVLNQIPAYKLPLQLGQLLNIAEGTVANPVTGKMTNIFASDLNRYYLGIWNPSPKKGVGKIISKPPKEGFTSFFTKDSGEANFYSTALELPGARQLTLQDFSNIKVWSMLQDYANPVLNECYTCFRTDKNGFVYPSLIVRQKPYNTPKYLKAKKKQDHTQFLDIPRWKISPDLITDFNIGRSDAARVNFVQVFTRSLSVNDALNQAQQIQKGNYVVDEDDVIRNGRKTFIQNCNYDYPNAPDQYKGDAWAELVADWVMNSHLKLNGSISCIGIEDPICIGDNLEFDRVVYQIESIAHNMVISPDGAKSFRTNISLSMGIDERSDSSLTVYGEMDHTDSLTKRIEDFKREKVLPGFSDTQDIPNRANGEEVTETRQKSFTNPNSLNKGKK